jgi:hypothetical protein
MARGQADAKGGQLRDGKCSHPVFAWAHQRNAITHGVTRSWCGRCGQAFPVGPARIAPEDADAIAIELRAAELANMEDTGTPDEQAGWTCHSYQAEHEHDETAPYLAGWLARVIATHGQEDV